MRIIKQEPYNRITCARCKSQLEFSPRDVQVYSIGGWGSKDESVYYVTCPVCGKQRKFKASELPEATRRDAERRHFSD